MPATGTCSGSISIYDNSGGSSCSSSFVATYPLPTSCLDFNSALANDGAKFNLGGVSATCTPTGGTPSGSVIVTRHTTVCCLP